MVNWVTVLVGGVGFECNCWYFNTGPVPVLEKYGYPSGGYVWILLE